MDELGVGTFPFGKKGTVVDVAALPDLGASGCFERVDSLFSRRSAYDAAPGRDAEVPIPGGGI
jgi:hypothetical protein